MIPTLFDSNIFIALDRKFGLSEAVSLAKELLGHSRKAAFDPVILACVLEEIHRKEMKSALLSCCQPLEISDDDGRAITRQTTCNLTQGGVLTDYKLIAAGLSLSKDRPLLVSSDYLLRQEYARIVAGGDVMTPYQFTAILNQKDPATFLKTMTQRLLSHFLENESPEAFMAQQQELRQQIAAQRTQPVIRSEPGGLAASYLAGGTLTRGEKKAISDVRPLLDQVKSIASSDDPLSLIEELRVKLSSTDCDSMEKLSVVFDELGPSMVEKGIEAQEAGHIDLAARYLDEAATFLSLSSQGQKAFLVQVGARRAIAYLLKGDPLQAIRILQSLSPLLEPGDVKGQGLVRCTLAAARIANGEGDQATDCLGKVPAGIDGRRALKDLGDLFYRHWLYQEALMVYSFLIRGGWFDAGVVEPLYRSAGILGRKLEDEIVAAIPKDQRKEDHTRCPMPYLTKDSGKERTVLEDPETPKYLRDPMKVCSAHLTPKGTMLVCWNEGLSSRIGVNLPQGMTIPANVDSIRLNTGPVTVKTTMHGPLYSIRGEIDTTAMTDLEVKARDDLHGR